MLENRSTILKKKRRIKSFIQNYMQRKRATRDTTRHAGHARHAGLLESVGRRGSGVARL